MKKIISLILLIFLTGCTITGNVVNEIEQQDSKEIQELNQLKNANITTCYQMETQQLRESCFIKIAKETNNPEICDNLMGNSLKNICLDSLK